MIISVIICQQVFSKQPSSLLIPPGENATLACVVKNMGGECRWQKNGKPVGLFPGKYSLASGGVPGDCSLSIARVDLKIDDGEWQCQVGIISHYLTQVAFINHLLTQVTSSSISSQDALVSSPAQLTVQG